MTKALKLNVALLTIGDCETKKQFCLYFCEQIIRQSEVVIPSKALLRRNGELSFHFSGKALASMVDIYCELNLTKQLHSVLTSTRIHKPDSRGRKRVLSHYVVPKRMPVSPLETVLPIVRNLSSDEAFHLLMIVKKVQYGHKHNSFCPYELKLSECHFISDVNVFTRAFKSEPCTETILNELCYRISREN